MPTASDVFAQATAAGRMTFMPFITAGDPDLATTGKVLRALADANVDLIELGFPYSDPIADGPVIQASYTRALDSGIKVRGIFEMMEELPTSEMPPVFAMVSFAIVFRFGLDEFLTKARDCGFSGLIIPDLPTDEAEEFGRQTAAKQLDLVQLIAPTTTSERTEIILSAAQGFVYCISVAGTTGARQELPEALAGQLKDLRKRTILPLAVGFGISSPDQVATLENVADGVIVGSAIVRLIAEADSPDAAVSAVKEFSAKMNSAVATVAPSLSNKA
jgi:tryptophan synthase alpha chain